MQEVAELRVIHIPSGNTMNRLLALLTVGLVAGVAVADLAPPEGYKRVDGIHKITTEKDIEGYTFYKIEVPRKLAVAVKFDSEVRRASAVD